MDAERTIRWVRRIVDDVTEAKERLSDLDRAIGDGDHGTNLARGFAQVRAALDSDDDAPTTPGAVLILTGRTLISHVGGAAGPLYGSAFRAAGKSLGDTVDADGTQLAEALTAAIEAVKRLGGAAEGSKTMIDALSPARVALARAIAAGAENTEMARRTAEAAAEGSRGTIEMVAKKGRASYLGERSAGHEDPGAASTALMLLALTESSA